MQNRETVGWGRLDIENNHLQRRGPPRLALTDLESGQELTKVGRRVYPDLKSPSALSSTGVDHNYPGDCPYFSCF